MKYLGSLFIFITVLLTVHTVLSETVDRKKLVVRNGILYKHFSSVPYSGIVTGQWAGKLVDGKKFGPWKTYWLNGSLASEGKYISGGIKTGVWKHYDTDGRVVSKYTYSAEESLRDKAKGNDED
tara:strand:+ start:3333 stop:3704 length:372 start_codon:yes stop_codon:yes gene_type:complete